MPRSASNAIPSYRLHKPSGQAVVCLSGDVHYLGPHGSSKSRKRYDQLVAEWVANGRVPLKPDNRRTIVETVAAYKRFAKAYYRQGGEYDNMMRALRQLVEFYGRLPIAEFSPLKLKTVREKMVETGLCRNEVNQRVGRIRRFFSWGVENELVPPSVLHGLKAVRGLAHGRTNARETEPIKPVPEVFVDAVRGKVSPQVWAMIQLQRFTGMRPGEVVAIRTCDVDTSGKVWVFTPSKHKNAWRGCSYERRIYFGPQAQAVLKPWLRPNVEEPLFQPREAEAWHRRQRRLKRRTALSCGNTVGSNVKAKPKRKPGASYSPRTYYVAVRRACSALNVPIWSPNRLRHNAATRLRREFGLTAR